MSDLLKDFFYKIGIYKQAKKYLMKPYGKFRGVTFRLSANQAIKLFLEVMNNNGFKYWLEFGSLLGAIREKGLIPHDCDFDVAMFIEDRDEKMEESLVESGFHLIRRARLISGEIIEETYKYKTAHIDIFYAYKEGGKVKVYSHQTFDNLSPSECIKRHGGLQVYEYCLTGFDLISYEFLGINVGIPGNYHSHLVEVYGQDYMIPNKNWSEDSCSIRIKTNKFALVEYP